MQNIITWVSMGGYGEYIASAYGVLIFGLVGMILFAKKQRQHTKRSLNAWYLRRK